MFNPFLCGFGWGIKSTSNKNLIFLTDYMVKNNNKKTHDIFKRLIF